MRTKLQIILGIAICLGPGFAATAKDAQPSTAQAPKPQSTTTAKQQPQAPESKPLPADGRDADPEWLKHADVACTKAAGKPARAIPDLTVIDVEKCDRVDCDAGAGRRLKTNLPDGTPCIRYLIVTPPPTPKRGKCVSAHCNV
jgi:hypothetical protein